MSDGQMSLESALDEERREVLALLEGVHQDPLLHRASSASAPSPGRAVSSADISPSRPEQRSMLDVHGQFSPRHASIASTNGGITSLSRPHRSMLDTANSPPTSIHSAQTSPTDSRSSDALHQRSRSDASSQPSSFGPRAANAEKLVDYPFTPFSNASSTSLGGRLPKKTQHHGTHRVPTSIEEAMRADAKEWDPSQAETSTVRGAFETVLRQSKSPNNRMNPRSGSPYSTMLRPSSKQLAVENGTTVDGKSAYRRLSDANMALAGGILSTLSGKGRRRTDSGGAIVSPGLSSRLRKEYFQREDAVTSSSSDESDSGGERRRGRRASLKSGAGSPGVIPNAPRRIKGAMKPARRQITVADDDDHMESPNPQGQRIKSLLDPEITVTGPAGDKTKVSKARVHPSTAFDQTMGSNTPMTSDTEADLTDIKRAQKLAIIMTPVVSTPKSNRCVRTMYRGDFGKMQKEAEENARRVRKYLVATDLSDEAAHALEWTVGTVLRDGDTLLAIYCVDEETGIGEAAEGEVSIADEARAITATTIAHQQMNVPGSKQTGPSPLSGVFNSAHNSPTPSPMGRRRSPQEAERFKAVEDITTRVSRLLRKTRLQVRVVIEVIHCKSPKHLITEVIDYLNPTLVILGSRGRSALKGVILGSFSNYLVTKSSVPVMVARKKLKKHTKYKRPAIKLANNLNNVSGRSLAAAKID